MAYEKEKDAKQWEKSITVGKSNLLVQVWQYDGGQSKLQIGRTILRERDQQVIPVKLGRLTKEEIEAIQPILEEAKAQM